jgi:hypothetical protein
VGGDGDPGADRRGDARRAWPAPTGPDLRDGVEQRLAAVERRVPANQPRHGA